MITFAQLTYDSFQRKLRVFGLTTKNRKEIEKYSKVSLGPLDSVPDAADAVNEAYIWLDKNLGDNWIWSTSLGTDTVDIYFIHASDALMFKLRFKTA